MIFVSGSISTPTKTISQKDAKLVVAIDSSLSTHGDVLKMQKEIAKKISARFEQKTFLAWNSYAQVVKNLNSIVPKGGTNPVCFVSLMKKNKIQCDFLVLFTDSKIHDLETFRNSICSLDLQCPIVVVIMTKNFMYDESDISVAEACLSASSNVAVCATLPTDPTLRVVLATGCFKKFMRNKPTKLMHSIPLSYFDYLDFDQIWSNQSLTISLVPQNIIVGQDERLFVLQRDFLRYINDPQLPQDQDSIRLAVESIVLRENLPKLDADRMLHAMHGLRRQVERHLFGGEIFEMHERLFSLVSQVDAEGERIKITKQQIADAKASQTGGLVSDQLISTIENAIYVLSAYAADKTRFNYFDPEESQPDCISGVCPVLAVEDALAVIFTAPKRGISYSKLCKSKRYFTVRDKKSVEKWFARNNMADSSICGSAMLEALVPGVYGTHFAKSSMLQANTLTQQPFLGYMPLSRDMNVVCRSLSHIFGQAANLNYLLRGYVAMVAELVSTQRSVPKELVEHAKIVLFSTKSHSRKVGENAIFADAIVYMVNHPECFHSMSYKEAMSVFAIAKYLLPSLLFEQQKVSATIEFVNAFRQVRDKYISFDRSNMDPLCIFQECFAADGTPLNTPYARIAWAFGQIHLVHGHTLRLLRFEPSLLFFLTNATPSITCLYNGLSQQVDEAFLPAIPKNNLHFDLTIWAETFRNIVQNNSQPSTSSTSSWSITGAISRLFYGAPCNFKCQFCHKQFSTSAERNAHIKQELGDYNLDLIQILLHNRQVLSLENILPYLQKRYGPQTVVIYSSWVQQQVQNMKKAIEN